MAKRMNRRYKNIYHVRPKGRWPGFMVTLNFRGPRCDTCKRYIPKQKTKFFGIARFGSKKAALAEAVRYRNMVKRKEKRPKRKTA